MRYSLKSWVLAIGLLVARIFAAGQCQPSPASPSQSSTTQPQFYDEPKFNVAGVTETSNIGGHGSDTIWRTKESLAKETVGLAKNQEAAPKAVSDEHSLEKAAHQPGNFEANHLLGKLLLDQGKAEDALPYLEQASRMDPSDYSNSYDLATAYAKSGDLEHARAEARNLLARQDKAEVHSLLGQIEETSGHPLDAVHEYQRAAEMEPSEPNLFDWGSELLLHHAPEPAVEVLAKGNRLFPGSGRMLMGLGVAWYDRGAMDRATACLCEASDLNPKDSKPYLFLGKIANVETASEPVAERLKRFANLEPDNALANYYYAVTLLKQRSGAGEVQTTAEAESLLQNAVELDPKLGSAYLQLGNIYSERRETAKAIAAYKQAADADPKLETAHYRLSLAYRQVGQKEKADQELRLYEELSKQSAHEAERERRELQQFVYTLRDRDSSTQPQ